jgi:signal transduction histidine kinase
MSSAIDIHTFQQPALEFDREWKLIRFNPPALHFNIISTGNEGILFEDFARLLNLNEASVQQVKSAINAGTSFTASEPFTVNEKWFKFFLLPTSEKRFYLFFNDVTKETSDLKRLIKNSTDATILFNNLPIVIWEEDFSEVKRVFNNLKELGVEDLVDYFEKHPDKLIEAAGSIKVTDINKTSYEFYNADSLEELLTKIPEWFTVSSWKVFAKELDALYKGAFEYRDEIEVRSPKGVIKTLIVSVYVPEANRKNLDHVIVSFLDITDRVEAEKKVLDAYRQITKLSHHMENIREEERKRISREIHDHAGSLLTLLKINMVSLKKDLGSNETANKKVDLLLNSVVEIAGLIRSIGASLRPSILDTMGLVPALKWLADEFAKNSGLKIYFNVPIGTTNINISDEISIGIYRIFQEAINNVLKHAKATEVVVNMAIDEQKLILRIIDNGIGFQQKEKKPGDAFSMGLLSMQERCAMLKGSLNIDSEPGEGTVIELSIPLNSKTETPLHA